MEKKWKAIQGAKKGSLNGNIEALLTYALCETKRDKRKRLAILYTHFEYPGPLTILVS